MVVRLISTGKKDTNVMHEFEVLEDAGFRVIKTPSDKIKEKEEEIIAK